MSFRIAAKPSSAQNSAAASRFAACSLRIRSLRFSSVSSTARAKRSSPVLPSTTADQKETILGSLDRLRAVTDAATGSDRRVAFLFSGQGSQYPNMLRALREAEGVAARLQAERPPSTAVISDFD